MILFLPLLQVGQLSVTDKSMLALSVGIPLQSSLPWNSVILFDVLIYDIGPSVWIAGGIVMGESFRIIPEFRILRPTFHTE